jgi:hypothetical protein
LSTYVPIQQIGPAQEDALDDEIAKLEDIANSALDSGELNPTDYSAVTAYLATLTGARTLDDKADAFAALGHKLYEITDTANHSNDARLELVTFSDNVSVTEPFYADFVNYAAAPTDGSGTLASNTLSVKVTPIDSGAAVSFSSDNGSFSGNTVTFAQNGAATITVSVDNSGNTRDYTFTLNVALLPSGGANPYSVDGYLPLGQYATTGKGWGSISKDDANSLNYGDGSPAQYPIYQAAVKGLTGYESGGVSLGAAGGYVQYEFADPVQNAVTNPFGVDFVIYGNAFANFAEAGAVKVSSDGSTWYELAGSRYYTDSSNPLTQQNVDVAYKRITTVSTEFPETGIYYKITQGAAVLRDWTLWTGSVAWWPDAGENYGNVYGSPQELYASAAVNDVTYDTSADEITYANRTLILGSNATADFAFGYADAHSNSATPDGAAVNPYLGGMGGGDGFDISWAVDASGSPADLPSVKYVRVYTASVLDPNLSTPTDPVFLKPGVFGEISTEITGVFTALGSGGSAATTDLEVWNSEETVDYPTTNMGVETLVPGGYVIYSSEANVYVNGEKVDASNGYPVTLTSGNLVRIITQSGYESPYLTLLKAN